MEEGSADEDYTAKPYILPDWILEKVDLGWLEKRPQTFKEDIFARSHVAIFPISQGQETVLKTKVTSLTSHDSFFIPEDQIYDRANE